MKVLRCHTVTAVKSCESVDARVCLATKLGTLEGGYVLPWSVAARRGMALHVLSRCLAAGQKHHARPAQLALGTPPAGHANKSKLSNGQPDQQSQFYNKRMYQARSLLVCKGYAKPGPLP